MHPLDVQGDSLMMSDASNIQFYGDSKGFISNQHIQEENEDNILRIDDAGNGATVKNKRSSFHEDSDTASETTHDKDSEILNTSKLSSLSEQDEDTLSELDPLSREQEERIEHDNDAIKRINNKPTLKSFLVKSPKGTDEDKQHTSSPYENERNNSYGVIQIGKTPSDVNANNDERNEVIQIGKTPNDDNANRTEKTSESLNKSKLDLHSMENGELIEK